MREIFQDGRKIIQAVCENPASFVLGILGIALLAWYVYGTDFLRPVVAKSSQFQPQPVHCPADAVSVESAGETASTSPLKITELGDWCTP